MPEDDNLAINEQSSVKERLLRFIKFKKLNTKQFEEMASLSTSYVSNMRKSIKAATFDEKIAPVFPELNKLWLLHGEGSMINGNEKVISDIDDAQSIGLSPIKNKPHDEQMEILFNKIEDLESTIEILKERDQLYFKAIISHLGIGVEMNKEYKENKKSSTS